MFDFNLLKASILSKDNLKKTPQDIFSELVQDKISYLRSVQDEVLKDWYQNRDKKITLLKMNTGAGKTLVGLLILLTLSNEKKGKMLYVTPDNYLTEQVINEAKSLNIKIAANENDREYLQGEAILVVNINKLVNGLSVFGVECRNEKTPDYIVFDDSHSCIKVIKDQFTVRISSDYSIFNNLFALFESALKRNRLSTTSQIKNHDPTAVMRVPFYAWIDNLDSIVNLLVNADDEFKDTIKFSFPLLKDLLPYCEATISGSEISIYPLEDDLSLFAGISESRNQIFMSANFGDDSELPNLLNIKNEKTEICVVTPEFSNDVGERLILSPYLFNSFKYEENYKELDELILEYSKRYNVLVIVPSFKRSMHWATLGANIIRTENIETELLKIKSGGILNSLNVLVNRYNGIDLPKDACRLIVMDGVPIASSNRDLLDSTYVDNTKSIKSSIIGMIEQGMGRGIRDNKDWCGILLYDIALSNFVFVDDNLQYFSKATQKQIELSNKVLDQFCDKNAIESIKESFDFLFNRDIEWIAVHNQAFSTLKNNKTITTNEYESLAHEAFQSYCMQDYGTAANLQEKAINLISDNKLKALYKERLSRYYYLIDKSQSKQILLSALRDNRYICKTWEQNTSFIQFQNNIVQAKNIISLYKKNKTFFKATEYLSLLQMGADESFRKFEESLCEIGKIIGGDCYRPEIEFSENTLDVLWVSDKYAIAFSCKNQAVSETIKKEYIDAMHSDVIWVKNNFKNKEIFSVIVYPEGNPSDKVFPDENLYLFDSVNLIRFKTNVKSFFSELEQLNNLQESTVNILLSKYKLTFEDFISNYLSKLR